MLDKPSSDANGSYSQAMRQATAEHKAYEPGEKSDRTAQTDGIFCVLKCPVPIRIFPEHFGCVCTGFVRALRANNGKLLQCSARNYEVDQTLVSRICLFSVT